MAKARIVGLPNLLAAEVVTITAGAEDAGGNLPASNLKDWHNPTYVARLIGVDTAAGVTILPPHKTYWDVDFGSVAASNIAALALGRYSLVPGDQVRFIGVSSGSLPPVRSAEVTVDAVDASANVDSTDETRIDEGIEAVDGSRITTVTPETESFLLLSYGGAPASAPAIGDVYQCFLVYVARSHVPTNPEDYGRITCTLYESGSPVQSLGTKVVNGSTCYLFPWDAGWLADPSCADMQLRIDIYDPSAVGAAARIDCAPWHVVYQGDVDTCDVNSGWITVTGQTEESEFGGTAIEEVDAPPPLIVHYLSAATSLLKARIEIRGDGAGFFSGFLHGEPRSTARFIDAGYAAVNFAYEFPYNFVGGGELRTEFKYVGGQRAIDGSSRLVIQYRWREAELEFLHMPRSHAEALYKRMYAAGAQEPFILTLDPSDPNGYGTFLAVAQEFGGYRYSGMARRNAAGELEATTRNFRLVLTEKIG